MRMKLVWLANSRPDFLFEITTLAQVTQEHFAKNKRDCLKGLNLAMRYAVSHCIPLVVSKLELSTVKVVGFYDSSFANNRDLSTQLGYVILLCDAAGNETQR